MWWFRISMAMATIAIQLSGAPPVLTDKFDVAIARPVRNSDTLPNAVIRSPRIELLPSGIFQVSRAPLVALVVEAYGSGQNILVGLPDWVSGYLVDVSAKAPAGTSTDRFRAMLRNFLEEEFHVRVHQEERPWKAFVLERGKGPVAMHSSSGGAPECKPLPQRPGEARVARSACTNMSMKDLAGALPAMAPGYIKMPVVDHTSLDGGWDFDLAWSPVHVAETEGGTTIFASIEKLGLKISSGTVPLMVTVVDHIEEINSSSGR